MNASQAMRLGVRVETFVRETADGRKLAFFTWGELYADGNDCRGAEVLGAYPFGSVTMGGELLVWLLENAASHDLAELVPALRRKAREIREREWAARKVA